MSHSPHSRDMPEVGGFITYSNLLKYFNALPHNISSPFPKVILFRTLIKLVLFSLFACVEEAEGGGQNEEGCSTPGAIGTPGPGDALVGSSGSWLVDLMAAGVHITNQSALPSSRAPALNMGR